MHRSALIYGFLSVSAAFVLSSQSKSSQPQGPRNEPFSPLDWSVIDTLSPLPDLPVDTTNKYRDSPAAALLGQKLFFEPRLSGPIQTGTPQEGQLGAIGAEIQDRLPQLPHAGIQVALRHSLQQRRSRSPMPRRSARRG